MIEYVVPGFCKAFSWTVSTALRHHLLELLIMLCLLASLHGFVDVSDFKNSVRDVPVVLEAWLVGVWIELAFGGSFLGPVVVRGLVPLLSNLRHQVKILIPITGDTLSSSVEDLDIFAVQDPGSEGDLTHFFIIHFLPNHFHAVDVTFDIVWMK